MNQVIALHHDPSVVPKEKVGTNWYSRLKNLFGCSSLLELAVSVLCLGGSCCSPISSSLSLLLPTEVKMSHWVSSWSPSSPISPRIPQETSCRIVTLWQHHFLFTLLWTCSLPAKKGLKWQNLWGNIWKSVSNLHVIFKKLFCLNNLCVFWPW